jgi:Tol biopolymer transport system component
MPLKIDSVLHGRYRILEGLDSGGMGAVYRGRDENLGIEVAIKENLFVSPETGRQFKREAELLANLRHPNLPRVTDYFVIEGQGQYLVMDFVPGENAHNLRKRQKGALTEEEVLQWAAEILDAIEYLHSQTKPIIHRDIKPGNIKITPDGEAVLVDFGLAKAYQPSETTTVGARALTPGYAPPEQYGHGRTDERTDIFSLGATLYALLTGDIPADSIRREMGLESLTPILEHNPIITPHVAKAIEHALNTKPDERFASISDFRAALLPEPSTKPQTVPPTVVHEPAAPTIRRDPAAPTVQRKHDDIQPRRFPTVAIVGILLVGVVGIGAVLVLTGTIPLGGRPADFSPTPSRVPTELPSPTEQPIVAVVATDEPEPSPSLPTNTPTATEIPIPEDTPTPAATPVGGGHGQIAFVSHREGLPQIFIMDIDGSNQLKLTSLGDGACQPAWSPDGQNILFISPCRKKSDLYPNAAIYVMNADGSNVQPLITKIGGVFDPEWSEAGILFTYLENTKPRIWAANADGSGAHQISRSNAYDRQPSWSPEGDRIVLLNNSRSGSPTLYWVYDDGSFDGSNPDQVTREQLVDSPAWSPSGELIAYVSKGHIWIIPWHSVGFGEVQLTIKGPNADPAWSPDGQWITFETWRDAANHDIYIMTENGGLQTRLTEHQAQDYQPAWRP